MKRLVCTQCLEQHDPIRASKSRQCDFCGGMNFVLLGAGEDVKKEVKVEACDHDPEFFAGHQNVNDNEGFRVHMPSTHPMVSAQIPFKIVCKICDKELTLVLAVKE